MSIIVTNYNYGQYIAACLESVNAQTYPRWECLVVDDASTDESARIIENFVSGHKDRFRFVRHRKNLGQMNAFKTGLANTDGEFVVFLDADDMLFPDFLDTHIKVHLSSRMPAAFTCSEMVQINDNKELVAGAVGFEYSQDGGNRFFDGRQRLVIGEDGEAGFVDEGGRPMFLSPTAEGNQRWRWTATSAMMFRRPVLNLLMPGKMTNTRICADYYLCVFAHQVGGSILIPSVHGVYRRHGRNNYSINAVLGSGGLMGPMSRHPPIRSIYADMLDRLTRDYQRFIANLGIDRFEKLIDCFRLQAVYSPPVYELSEVAYLTGIKGLAERVSRCSTRCVLSIAAKLSPRLRDGLLRYVIGRSGLFNAAYYVREHPEAEGFGDSPLYHYLAVGAGRKYKPNYLFEPDYYETRCSAMGIDCGNPLLHYLLYGAWMGLDPGPDFKTDFYLGTNHDVRVSGVNPLAHYLRYGAREKRWPTPAGPGDMHWYDDGKESFDSTAAYLVPLLAGCLCSPFPTLVKSLRCLPFNLGRHYRRLTNNYGKPSFIIIGAQKCGTSTLFHWLRKHPDITMVSNQCLATGGCSEFRFFFPNRFEYMSDEQFEDSVRWYLSHFPAGRFCGEKSPGIISFPKCHEYLHRVLPDARFVLMLRNPTERAFSAYRHYKRDIPASVTWDWLAPGKSFEENLDLEEAGKGRGFIRRGMYVDDIERLLSYYPRENLHIIVFEKLLTEPRAVLRELCAFLGVDQEWYAELGHKNRGWVNKNMSAETRERLDRIYRPYNERLFEFLGYEIKEWNAS